MKERYLSDIALFAVMEVERRLSIPSPFTTYTEPYQGASEA